MENENQVKKHPAIDSSVQMSQILEFSVAFPNETPQSIDVYLKGGSKNVILNVASFFLGFKPYNSKYNDNKELLKAIFGPENNDIANEIYDKIKPFEKKGTRIGVINIYSSLNLFERFFSKEENIETQSDAEFERNMFKAYLVLNSEFTEVQSIAFSSTNELDDKLKVPMKMFCAQYPVSDKMNYDIHQIWITQIIKAIYLFQFLEKQTNTQPLLDAFLNYFKQPTWQEYLKWLVPLTIPAIQNEKEAHTDILVKNDDKFMESCAFIEKLIVQENEALDENDFLSIRSKPFYKIKDGVYRIIFDLFVVEKIFKGVYFLLRDVNKTLPKKDQIKELKSFFGYEFSEKVLCYKVVESIFPEKCIRYSGDELDNMKIDGAPDYYVRKGKDILLFESKDFLIRADKKSSFDFNVYEKEFQKVLYFEEMTNGSIKNKAVMQLINNIRTLLKTDFEADTNYYYKDISIYPILLTHDHQYDTVGFNNLIDYWFQEELEELKNEGLFIHHIKPLTVVNVDSLIYHQVGLLENISLNKVLEAYHEYVFLNPRMVFKTENEHNDYIMSKTIPFSLFIYNFFNEKGIKKIPSMIDIIKPALFSQELKKNDQNNQ
jgi:hypothetical protein